MQDYCHFYSLADEKLVCKDLLARFPSYFFLVDEQGQLAVCEQRQDLIPEKISARNLLSQLPNLDEEHFHGRPERAEYVCANFRLFAFISSDAQPYTLYSLARAQGQIALCLYADFAPHARYFEDVCLRTRHFRELLALCQTWEQGLLARAKELSFFVREFVYCSVCSASLEWLDGQYARTCGKCQNIVFPRQDPSVISLITWRQEGGEWLLLAHNYRFRQHMYSLIAGFVDAGENLEQALRREAWEEASVHLTEIQYLCSQAWPNMHSLMAGFMAQSEVAPPESRPDGREIESLLWLEKRDLCRYLAADELSEGRTLHSACKLPHWYISESSKEPCFCLPERGTISRKLIEQWAKGYKE